jgi:Cys-tRNA(Pro)/Cys-tRNA(Cys) deacylase
VTAEKVTGTHTTYRPVSRRTPPKTGRVFLFHRCLEPVGNATIKEKRSRREKAMAQGKTNAMRLLDAAKMEYSSLAYDSKDGKIDGVSVAGKIGRDPKQVYKTLVAQAGKNVYVFIIPVEAELDLKKAAKAAGEKKVEMIPVKDIQKLTGYIRGGCSPVGMKKLYPTFIDSQAEQLESIIVSGGKIGLQIELAPERLKELIKAQWKDLVKE